MAMSSEYSSNQPFRALGGRLKRSRESRNESLIEASGAVEIEIDTLEQIEHGEQRPSEEILLLLISHFEIEDDEASDLWELAGYNSDDMDVVGSTVYEAGDQSKQAAFVLPMDIRVVYTDMVNVIVNNYGVVMNFIQNSGPNNQPLAVARVGMSREHAESVIQILQQTLAQADQVQTPKTLSAPKPTQKTDKN
jgi:transcriptional regulator with XRE-family HTH domain